MALCIMSASVGWGRVGSEGRFFHPVEPAGVLAGSLKRCAPPRPRPRRAALSCPSRRPAHSGSKMVLTLRPVKSPLCLRSSAPPPLSPTVQGRLLLEREGKGEHPYFNLGSRVALHSYPRLAICAFRGQDLTANSNSVLCSRLPTRYSVPRVQHSMRGPALALGAL